MNTKEDKKNILPGSNSHFNNTSVHESVVYPGFPSLVGHGNPHGAGGVRVREGIAALAAEREKERSTALHSIPFLSLDFFGVSSSARGKEGE